MSDYEPQPEKTKNDDAQSEKRKNDSRPVEWSFDFANLGQSIRNVFDSLSGDEEIHESHYETPLNGATHAKIQVHYAAGEGTFKALSPDSEWLFWADAKHVGELEFKVDGDKQKSVTLRQKMAKGVDTIRQGFRAVSNHRDLVWDVAVSPRVPLELEVNGGVGPVVMDLTGLIVTDLEVDNGVGTINVTLPDQSEPIKVELDGGVGQTTLNIPTQLSATIDIDGGVGAVDVNIPQGVAIQVRAETGIGGINLPKELHRTKGKAEFMDNSGVWQTEGYELAERRIVLKYDGGVGALNVRYHKVATV